VLQFDSAEKTLRSSFENLRTNGGEVEIIGDFPFMLSLVEAFIVVFQQNHNVGLGADPTMTSAPGKAQRKPTLKPFRPVYAQSLTI
jgi:hypothetical protein